MQRNFENQLATSGFELPVGYRIEYAGAAAERNDAVGQLVVNGVILFTLMVVTLVACVNSFRLAGVLFWVAFLAVGFSVGTLWLFDLPWGFMSIVGMMGMIGIAVNDSIVVLASLQELPEDQRENRFAVSECVRHNLRHVIATTLTTVAGFAPLVLSGGDFWPPVALSICGGVLGATILAIFLVPVLFSVLQPKRV